MQQAIIEKHFTIDRRLPGPDQAVSIEPDELADLSEFATLYNETSTEKKELADEEIGIKQWAQHSIVATETIDQGEELTKENTTTKRPGTGLSAERYLELLGSHTATTIPEGTVVTSANIEMKE